LRTINDLPVAPPALTGRKWAFVARSYLRCSAHCPSGRARRNEVPSAPQTSCGRLHTAIAPDLPLQPALHAHIVTNCDVEPHPWRALEVRAEDRAWRSMIPSRCDASASARESSICGKRAQMNMPSAGSRNRSSPMRSKAPTTLRRASPSRSCRRDRYLR